MSGVGRTFRVNFPEDGLVKLRDRLREKLKEFMGDYTDDTLVDYVIVLLRNGRSEVESGNELKVFLEDDSISFASWLWDHLSSNLDLYLQPSGSVAERQNESDLAEKPDQLDDALDLDFDNEVESPSKLYKIRHNREWKSLMQETEPLILRSTVVGTNPITNKSTLRRSLSPKPRIHRKRSLQDEQPIAKRVSASRPMLSASSRLLQFAVRDAVKTVQQSFSRPAPKRFRSAVSSCVVNSSGAHLPQGTRLAPRVVGTVATAIKAAAEAAEDVKLKCSLSFSDRLHQKSERSVASVPPSNIKSSLDKADEVYGQRTKHRDRRSGHGVVVEDMAIDKNNGLSYDSGSDYKRDKKMGSLGSLVGEVSGNASPKLKDSNSVIFQCSVPQNANDVMRKTLEDQEQSNVCTTKAQKILNISVNVNTWKPPDFQVSRETTEFANQIVSQSNEKDAGIFRPQLVKGTDNNLFATKNEILQSSNSQKDIPKPVPSHGLHSSTHPSEDADSRTVFVSNVHFGATKDNLSWHFNKFGEVLKVVIMTDGTTGQPTGSAYVEFLRKESAELALSLNETSFMSRILKVVRRSITSQETTGMTWPRIVRPSFAPRHARMPFSRVMVSPFRGRLPVKPGARSLQWKRDSPGTPSKLGAKNVQNSQVSSNALTISTARNLTYVRNEVKSDASASLA